MEGLDASAVDSPEVRAARRIAESAPGQAREAEAELYRLLAPRARRYGLRHLRDAHAAADLMQQERDRSVLVMSLYDDQPAEAVGLQLGLSAGNVRVIRHRGIDKLRRCVDAGSRREA